MSKLKINILFGIASGLMFIIYMLLIFAYRLVCKEVKEVIFANRGDVKSCIEPRKNTKEKIIRAKPITDESCTLQHCEQCSTLPPCFCGTNKGP